MAALLLSNVLTTTASAQGSDSASTRSGWCYRGRPAPACSSFVLTEIGYYRRVFGSTYTSNFGGSSSFTGPTAGDQLTWEVGAMRNRGSTSALGGTVLLGVGEAGARIGVKGRYRRWLSDGHSAVDAGAGLISGSFRTEVAQPEGVGLTGDLALNAADYGAVAARIDVLRGRGRTTSVAYGGVRLGSKPAIAGTILVGAGFLFLLAIFAHSDF